MIYYNFILLEELRAKDIGLKKNHEWDHIEIINAT
jgi:hypothetical protein